MCPWEAKIKMLTAIKKAKPGILSKTNLSKKKQLCPVTTVQTS